MKILINVFGKFIEVESEDAKGMNIMVLSGVDGLYSPVRFVGNL